MALEIRIVGERGALVRTLEDVTTPSLPVDLEPGTFLLGDYCFDESGHRWIRPEQILSEKDVAAVVFSRHGRFESMVVGEHRLYDEEAMRDTFQSLAGCMFTKYGGTRGQEIYIFLLPPYLKRKNQKP